MWGLACGLVLLSLALAGCAAGAPSALLATPTFTVREQQGERLFVQRCASCHSTIADTVVVGPSLAGVGSRAGQRMEGVSASEYLRQSIKAPAAYLVPGYRDQMPGSLAEALSEEEIDALLAYLMRLEE